MQQSAARAFARQFRTRDFILPTWIENKLLADFQPQNDSIEMPLVAIVGPPRVGSTLMYQILASNTNCFFFDNLQHTLLRYPYLGFLLSERFVTRDTGGLKSDHGFIGGIGGLSEGNFFWPFWFDMDIEQKTPQPVGPRLQHVRRVFNRIYDQTKMPMVSSFNSHAFYLAELARQFPSLVIVNMRREPVANAVSLLRGRREIVGDIDTWWSIRPASCVESRYPDPYSQIVCQIVEVYSSVKQQRGLIAHVPVIDVNYSDLCENPRHIFDQILAACDAAGIDLDLRSGAPSIPDLKESGPRPAEAEDVTIFKTLIEQVDWDDLWSNDGGTAV
jgi:hypothetical protein